MGICYSSIRAKKQTDEEEEGRWWRREYEDGVNNVKKKSKSGGTFVGKFGGGSRGTSDDHNRGLHHVSGRLFGNGASRIANLYTQQGKKGTNQDAMIVWENFSSRSDTVFCGVFDGHGPYGHLVARRVRDSLPVLLCNQMKANSSDDQSCPCDNNGTAVGNATTDECLDEDWSEPLEVEDNGKLPEMYLPLKQSILKAFKLMDKELKLHPIIDCFCSGTTAVTLLKQGQDLIIGNVGDSRAVMARRDKGGSLAAVQLTVDLKPNLPREAARIQQCKGRVFALQDEPEVARVWLPNSDSPGLAMARAFGDFCLKDFGLISVPDVYYRHLTESDEFIVLASDGVWDVLSNKEAIDIVAAAPTRSSAARALVDCATRAWRLKYPTSKTDDCAVVCLFLDHVSVPDNDLKRSPEKALSEVPTTTHGISEIVPVVEPVEEKISEKCLGQSTRSLAECLSTAEDDEWSALEGITRVNSLLSIPRFLSRSASWRKWL